MFLKRPDFWKTFENDFGIRTTSADQTGLARTTVSVYRRKFTAKLLIARPLNRPSSVVNPSLNDTQRSTSQFFLFFSEQTVGQNDRQFPNPDKTPAHQAPILTA